MNYGLGPDVVNTNAGALVSVAVNVANTTIAGNSSEQATALASFANATNVPFNSQVTNWVSSNPGVITVSGAGLVQSVGPVGSATISATAFGKTGSVVISVSTSQPVITQDLLPVTKFTGSPTVLTVAASGGNLNYYWYRNSVLLPGQTSATLSLAAVALSDAANYYVTVSNAVGAATSSTVALTVLQQALTHRYSMDDANVSQQYHLLRRPGVFSRDVNQWSNR